MQDDLVFWTETEKRRAEEKIEQTLNKALSTLGKWCDKNNMLVNLLISHSP